MHEIAALRNGICLSIEYKTSLTQYLWKCDNINHPPFSANHNNVSSKNSWCPKCWHEVRAKNQIGKPGISWTEKRKLEFSEYAKGHGFGKWMEGKKASEDARANMSKSLLKKYASGERIVSDNQKRLISLANSGENNGMFGVRHTNEVKIRISEAAKSMWKSKDFRNKKLLYYRSDQGRKNSQKGAWAAQQSVKYKNTKPEREMEDILLKLGIKFKKQFLINNINHSYIADFYLPEFNCVIEVDGLYWHNYPHGNERDHFRTQEMIDVGFNVLRFWENNFEIDNVRNSLTSVALFN